MIGVAPCISVIFATAIVALGVSFSTSAYLQAMSDTHRTQFMITINMYSFLPYFSEQLTNFEKDAHSRHRHPPGVGGIPNAGGSNAATDPFDKFPFPSGDLLCASAVLLTVVVTVVFLFLWMFRKEASGGGPGGNNNTGSGSVVRPWKPHMLEGDEPASTSLSQRQYTNNKNSTSAAAAASTTAAAPPTSASQPSSDGSFVHPSIFRKSPDTRLMDIRQVRTAMKLFENATAAATTTTTTDHQESTTRDHDSALKAFGWSYNSTKNGVQYWSKPSPYSPVVATLFSGWIPGICAQDVQLVLDELDMHYKFDTLLVKRILIKRAPDGREWWRNETKSLVWGVKPRDVVTERVGLFLSPEEIGELNLQSLISVQEGKRAFALFADDYGQEYPEDPKYQRAKMCTSMILACEQNRPSDGGDGIFFVVTANVDPSGSVPSSVVNLGLSKGMERVYLQRDEFIEEAKTKKLYKKYYGAKR